MLRTQSWQPDTHDAFFETQWDDDDPDAAHVCIRAVIGGDDQADPQGAYETVLGQNQAKNTAFAAVVAAMPAELTKPVLDSDGDPTGDLVPKDKHYPQCTVADDGSISVAIPGTDAETAASISAVALKATPTVALSVSAVASPILGASQVAKGL